MRIYHRNSAIFAGIFTLIQGAVWAFFAVWSVGIYSCTFDYPYYTDYKNTLGNLFYYSYELGQCRYNQPERAPELHSPHRTYALMLTYGITSAVWIPSAILLLVAAVNKIHGKTGARCYYPWLFTTGALLVLDILATVYYSIDISNTMTVQDYRDTYPYVKPTQLRGVDGITVVPAVIMVIFSSRAIIIWIINAVIFGVIIQTVVAFKKRSPMAEFVEKEARMSPEDCRPSQWARVGGGLRSVAMPDLELPPQRPPVRWDDTRKNRHSMVIQSPTEERERPVVPARSAIRPTSLALPPAPAPPAPEPPPEPSSPFFNVYGKPTTPDSPQPVFARSNTITQIMEHGVDKERPWSYVKPGQLPSGPKAIPEPDYTLHRTTSSRPNILSTSSPASTLSEEEEIKPAKRYANNPNVWKVM